MRSRIGLPGPDSENGFTLVELLVAIVILGVISIPLSNVVIAYLRNADATTARLMESHDAQIASAYWAQDVASLGTHSATGTNPLTQSVWTGVPYNYLDAATGVAFDSAPSTCGTSPPLPPTPRAVVRLTWDDFVNGVGAATPVLVAYVVVQTGSGPTLQTELHRLRCDGSATTPASDITLAHDLDPLMPPTVACSGTLGCAAAPAVPRTVTLTLRLKNAGNRDTTYVVPLTGQRRQS